MQNSSIFNILQTVFIVSHYYQNGKDDGSITNMLKFRFILSLQLLPIHILFAYRK